MTIESSVRRTADIVRRALRTQSAAVVAIMPFDPKDKVDLLTWLRSNTFRGGAPSGTTRSYLTQRLRYAAQMVTRKAARRQNRLRGKSAPMAGMEALGEVAASPPWFTGMAEGIEIWATAAANAASSLLTASNGRREWSLPAVFACLARVTGEVLEAEGTVLSRPFAAALSRNPLFLALPASNSSRIVFSIALLHLRRSGNLRRDLQTAGLTAPRPDVWNAFLCELQVQYRRRAA